MCASYCRHDCVASEKYTPTRDFYKSTFIITILLTFNPCRGVYFANIIYFAVEKIRLIIRGYSVDFRGIQRIILKHRQKEKELELAKRNEIHRNLLVS